MAAHAIAGRRDMVRAFARCGRAVVAAGAISGDTCVVKGCACEAHIAPVAGDTIRSRRYVAGRFGDRGHAKKLLPIMTAAASRNDTVVIHAGAGPESHGVSMAGVARGSPGRNVP